MFKMTNLAAILFVLGIGIIVALAVILIAVVVFVLLRKNAAKKHNQSQETCEQAANEPSDSSTDS